MSEALRAKLNTSDALAHAGEVAQWTLLLLGWLWLGEQGSRLGWSLASGVVPVALWWTARLMCRGQAWVFRCPPMLIGFGGLLTALGVGLTSQSLGPAQAQLSLLMLALLWGLWSAMVETRSQVSTFEMGPLAWHPLLAGALVMLSLRLPVGLQSSPWTVSFLLTLCALVLWMRDQGTFRRIAVCRGSHAQIESLLAPSAMGLMMGSLWLDNTWCAGLGWSTNLMVAFHLALMAGLPVMVAGLLRGWGAARVSPHAQTQGVLVLLLGGALLLLGSSVWQGVLAIVLPAMAWALHCCRSRQFQATATSLLSSWIGRSLALLLGPLLLLWVGAASSADGPWPLRAAMLLFGILAAGRLALGYSSKARFYLAT
jgi:hypothetical protein